MTDIIDLDNSGRSRLRVMYTLARLDHLEDLGQRLVHLQEEKRVLEVNVACLQVRGEHGGAGDGMT